MTDRCTQCDKPHLYKTYVMKGEEPVWFCGPKCKNLWMVHNHSNGKRIHLTMLAIVVGLGALIGVVYAAGAQTIQGEGIICESELAATTISDDMRDDSTSVPSDESVALLDAHICAYHGHLVAVITGIVREAPFPVLAVDSVQGNLHAFLIVDDQ